MSPHPDPTTSEDGLKDGSAQADAAFYRRALHSLITVGTNLARNLDERATAPTPQQPPQLPVPVPAQPPLAPEAAIAAFDRLARAVRRCIALARTLNDPVPPAPDPARHRTDARKRILREVEDSIGRDAHESDHEGGHAEALAAELHDRLDAPDLEDDIGTRPIPDIIAKIRRDLGLASLPGAHPWKRRTPQDLADLHARAAAPIRPHAPGPAPQMPTPTPEPPPASPRQGTPAHAASPAAAPGPSGPPAAPVAQPVRTQGSDRPPGDPAGLVAAILRHPASFRDRWPPPTG